MEISTPKTFKEYFAASKEFGKLNEDQREFVNWLIDGLASERFDLETDSLPELAGIYGEETGESIDLPTDTITL